MKGADGVQWFAAPELTRTGPLDDETLTVACAHVGLARDEVVDHAWGVNGPRWAMLELADADAVRALRSSPLPDGLFVGVVGFTGGDEHLYEVRAFVAGSPAEDPVTGSLNAAVAAWQRAKGAAPASYQVKQGMQLGSDGLIHVRDDADGLWIGGAVRTMVRGTVEL